MLSLGVSYERFTLNDRREHGFQFMMQFIFKEKHSIPMATGAIFYSKISLLYNCYLVSNGQIYFL